MHVTMFPIRRHSPSNLHVLVSHKNRSVSRSSKPGGQSQRETSVSKCLLCAAFKATPTLGAKRCRLEQSRLPQRRALCDHILCTSEKTILQHVLIVGHQTRRSTFRPRRCPMRAAGGGRGMWLPAVGASASAVLPCSFAGVVVVWHLFVCSDSLSWRCKPGIWSDSGCVNKASSIESESHMGTRRDGARGCRSSWTEQKKQKKNFYVDAEFSISKYTEQNIWAL